MRAASIKLCILLVLPLGLFACSRTTTPARTNAPAAKVTPAAMVNDILRYVNQYRSSQGLPALTLLPMANDIAAQHSKNMAQRKTAFGHDGFEKRAATVGKAAGPMAASAENVAYGQLSAREVVDGWLNSPGHRKNISGNYALTGFGVYTDAKGVTFFTQLFFRKQ
jgi:uncharacterized protein YkwD